MRTQGIIFKAALRSFVGFVLLALNSAEAAVLYVDLNSSAATAPYATWATAATNIQDAIDAASDGDQVLVTNGVYQTGGQVVYGSSTNRVVINKAVSVQSVNGPAVTIIQGYPVPGDNAVRCVYMTNGAALTGFTLTQGATRSYQGDLWLEQNGGGAWCESTDAMITNCVFTGNNAAHEGGGIVGGTLEGCILSSNTVSDIDISASGGGGANGSVLNHCLLSNNSAANSGGGASGSTLNYCVVTGNTVGAGGGGAGVNNCTLWSCLVTTNVSGYSGGGAHGGTLNNCTLVENTAGFGGGAYESTLNNCIVYFNHALNGDGTDNHYDSGLNFCCTTPDAGPGNFTNAPGFINYAGGDFHLQAGSFCINAGDNTFAGTVDLDGSPRVVGPYVDAGAYEFQGAAPVPLSLSLQAAYTNVATGYSNAFTGDIDGHESVSFWDFGDGTLVSNQLNVIHSWASAGIYVVTLNAFNDDNPGGLSASVTIQVVADPVYYVALGNSSPLAPYSSWATAATSIQDAVDAAFAGGTVIVSNGVYEVGGQKLSNISGTNRVAVSKPLNVSSVNGPAVTIIKGYRGPTGTNDAASIRCVGLVSGSRLAGFTLTNGCSASIGGGVFGTANVTISNCVLVGNSAKSTGGGGISGNYERCILIGNTAGFAGGGVASGGLDNCLVVSNWAGLSGGAMSGGKATNCTMVGNFAGSSGGGTANAQVWNSIVFYNNVGVAFANGTNYTSSALNYCCVPPQSPGPPGLGNLTNAPALAGLGVGDFHLLATSRCINAGTNGYVGNALDLDGNPRVLLGAVDLGAYEFQNRIHYVRPPGSTPVSPFTNWSTAAANIQDAVDAAAPGDTIVVSNGVYQAGGRVVYGSQTNRVALTNAVILMSLSGSQATTIVGAINTRGALVGSNSVLDGFTITNGQARVGGDLTNETSGGGIWCATGGVVSNCVVTGCRALSSVGWGGGIYGGAIWNSTLTNNYAGFGGAAARAALNNCILASNSAPYSLPSGFGGGIYKSMATNCMLTANGWGYGTTGGGASQSTLNGCILFTNLGTYGAGGADACLLVNCTLTANQGTAGGSGAGTNYNCVFMRNVGSNGGATEGGLAYNCLMISNTASSSGGGADKTTLYNCTVAGNVAGSFAGGVNGATLYNSIVYYNSAPSSSNWSGSTLTFCCTTPSTGFGGISFAPLFANLAGGDLRLQSNSPCINSGTNYYAVTGADLDGNSRIIAGNVDIGAYELQNPLSTIPHSWLWQYGLPINSSTDATDADGDGTSNWQEWRAGTVPTNALSVFKLLSPVAGAPGVSVSWKSVNGRKYWIERATDLSNVSFLNLQSNISATGSTTSYADTNAIGNGPYFYRVGVQ